MSNPSFLTRPTVKVSALLAGTALALGVSAAGTAGAASGPKANYGEHTLRVGHHHGGVMGGHARRHAGKSGFGRMLRGLDLTETQRDDLFKLRHASAPQMREYRKAMRSARKSLRELTVSGQYEQAKADALADSLGKAAADMARMRAQIGQQIYQILTPVQRDKMKERMQKRQQKRRSLK